MLQGILLFIILKPQGCLHLAIKFRLLVGIEVLFRLMLDLRNIHCDGVALKDCVLHWIVVRLEFTRKVWVSWIDYELFVVLIVPTFLHILLFQVLEHLHVYFLNFILWSLYLIRFIRLNYLLRCRSFWDSLTCSLVPTFFAENLFRSSSIDFDIEALASRISRWVCTHALFLDTVALLFWVVYLCIFEAVETHFIDVSLIV